MFEDREWIGLNMNFSGCFQRYEREAEIHSVSCLCITFEDREQMGLGMDVDGHFCILQLHYEREAEIHPALFPCITFEDREEMGLDMKFCSCAMSERQKFILYYACVSRLRTGNGWS